MTFCKKALPALLVFALLLSIAGCGSPAAKTPATVTPESEGFGVQEGNYKDIEVKLDPGGYTLKEIVCEDDMVGPDGTPFSKSLTEDTDYIKNGDTYIFLKEFLGTLSSECPNYLVFMMDGGDNPVFTIHMIPDESGFTIDWMLMLLTPEDAIYTEQIANQSSMTSEMGLEELVSFYEEAMGIMPKAEINPQYEADWWYAVKPDEFIFTVYLTAGDEETNIILTFYLEDDQPM
jgi:hypothetical protein